MTTKDVSVGIGADNGELLRVLQESKSAVSEFFETVTEEGAGIGVMLEDIQSKFSSAFQFTGIAAGMEAINKIGETIERIGSKALEIRTVSSVLGVTTDQMQALQAAAEEAGVGSEVLIHAGERLVTTLTEARNGSGAAADKLLLLGVSTKQLADPTFGLIQLLGLMRDRLEDANTHHEMMNQLMLVLGQRSALAAAAIQEFDGTADGVAKTMARLNGLTEDQIERVGKAKVTWGEYFTALWNGFTKSTIGAQAFDTTGMNALTMGNAGSASQAQSAVKNENPFADLAEDSQKAGEQMVEHMTVAAKATESEWTAIQNEMRLQELENMKAGVEAFEQGSARKLAALKEEYRFAQEVYGDSQNEKVRAIYQRLIAEQRAFSDAQIRASHEAMVAEDEHVAKVLRGYTEKIDADGRYLAKQEQDARALDQLQEFSTSLVTRAAQQKNQVLEQEQRLNERVTQQMRQQWQWLSGTIESSFSGAIKSMLAGTATFADAMRSIFSSLVNALVEQMVKLAVEWIENLILTKVVQKSTAASGIAANAGLAATAAMASVAAIPFVGWAMAPEVGATTFGEAMAYESVTAAAAGGFDVPAGVNPITQLHEREMVLPANIADPLRNMIDQRGGGRGSSGRTVHIHGQRGSSFTADQLASMLKELGHRFVLS